MPAAGRHAEPAPASLWWVDLDDPSLLGRGLDSSLSVAEHERADRFVREVDRSRFASARASLRQLIAGQLNCEPAAVTLEADDRGKPYLAGSDLKLSISRSEGVALFALSRSMEVGVDVEAIREEADLDRIASRFFTDEERDALASLPPDHRRAAGFQCWARKEAYAKGTGEGITSSLRATHVGIGGRTEVGGTWFVQDVQVKPGFAAAIAGSPASGWSPEAARRFDPSKQGDRGWKATD